MDYQVTLTGQAERDLFAIVSFLAGKSPPVAEKIGLALLDSAESLGWLPLRGPIMRGRPHLRKIPHPPYYLIIYRVDERARRIEILRFWDGRQNPVALQLP